MPKSVGTSSGSPSWMLVRSGDAATLSSARTDASASGSSDMVELIEPCLLEKVEPPLLAIAVAIAGCRAGQKKESRWGPGRRGEGQGA